MNPIKDTRERDTCLKEIKICVPNLLNILDSIVDRIGGGGRGRERDLFDHFMIKRIFTLIKDKDMHMSSSKTYEENSYKHNLDFLVISH